MDNPDVRLLSVENEALLTGSLNLFENVWKIMEIAPADCWKERYDL